jgi:hypothetical protein
VTALCQYCLGNFKFFDSLFFLLWFCLLTKPSTMNLKPLHFSLFIISPVLLSCSLAPLPIDNSPLSSYTIILESSRAAGGAALNKCYADLDQAVTYDSIEAKASGTKADIKYSYIVEGGLYSRVLQPLNGLVFSNADSAGVSSYQFDQIRTAKDLTTFFNARDAYWVPGLWAFITEDMNDNVKHSIFMFYSGAKRGLLRIEPFAPRPAGADKASIIITVKMQP